MAPYTRPLWFESSLTRLVLSDWRRWPTVITDADTDQSEYSTNVHILQPTNQLRRYYDAGCWSRPRCGRTFTRRSTKHQAATRKVLTATERYKQKMAEPDKLNIDSIIQRLLEVKLGHCKSQSPNVHVRLSLLYVHVSLSLLHVSLSLLYVHVSLSLLYVHVSLSLLHVHVSLSLLHVHVSLSLLHVHVSLSLLHVHVSLSLLHVHVSLSLLHVHVSLSLLYVHVSLSLLYVHVSLSLLYVHVSLSLLHVHVSLSLLHVHVSS
uniref:Uncharacterized protein n=1 Tax=Knipowitschia caucasica TaxID=637954 RepID=A0AAV2KIC4_KNICA